jgi:hypothetical protein
MEAQTIAGRGRLVAKSAHPVRRHRRSNDLFAGIHQNSNHGRRVVDLTTDYLARLGNPTSITLQASVLAAVQLLVLSEQARTAALAASPPTVDQLDQIVRLESIAARSLRRLGLESAPPRKSAADVTLADIEAEHAAREAAP